MIPAQLPITSPIWQLSITQQGMAVADIDAIAQSVRILLTTEPGADPARPDFGVGLLNLIGQDMRLVKQLLRKRGTPQFLSYLPEVTVVDYSVKVPADVQLGRLEVTAIWTYKGSQNSTTVTL